MSKKSEARREPPFYIGRGLVNPALGLAVFGETEIDLPVKILEVLVFLARNNERVVTRNELIDEVWEGNYSVGEKAVTHAIWQLRQILEKELGSKFIETIHRKGYKLTVEVVFNNSETAPPENALVRSLISARLVTLLGIASLLVLISVLLFNFLQNENTENNLSATRLTDLSGREVNHAVSPDGNYLVFLSLPPDGGRRMYVKSLQNLSEPPRLLDLDEITGDGVPTWSSDSKHLALVRRSRDQGCQINTFEIESGVERVIGACADAYISWSPDGKWLAYVGYSFDRTPGIYLKDMTVVMGDYPADFNIVNNKDIEICCHEPLILMTAIEMAWSGDSQQLAFTKSKQFFSEDMFVYSLKDKSTRQVTDNVLDIRGMAWTEDSNYILYSDNSKPTKRSLYQLNIKTGHQENLNVPYVGKPVLSPDYKDLYYYVRKQDDSISRIQIAASGLSPFPVVDTTYNEKYSDYSTALNKIVYFSDAGNDAAVWTADVDGSNKKQLTQVDHQILYPSWSASGKYIAYLGIEGRNNFSKIHIIHVEDLSIRELNTPFKNHGLVRWANNDSELLVAVIENGISNIWLLPIDGGSPRRLTEKGAYFARLSPDRQFLYYHKGEVDRQLYRQGFPSGTEELVLKGVYISWGNWDIGSQGIMYIDHYKTYDSMEFYNFSTGQKQKMGKLAKRLMSSGGMMSYIENQNIIMFTQRERQQIDIVRSPNPHRPD